MSAAQNSTAVPVAEPDAAMSKKVMTSSAIGSALEWFDFVLYGAIAATVLPKLFFPALDPATATIASFAAFGVGFFARPVGAIVCGHLGDRIGRKRILVLTVVMMGIASILVGLLPSYNSIGIAAPILLVILRLIQGFAIGGEATGGQLMAIEYAGESKRGLYGALVNMGSPIAQTMANAMLFLFSFILTDEQFLSFGWRIPFLLSAVLVGVGFYMRMRLAETPHFRLIATGKQEKIPVGELFARHGMTMLRLTLIWITLAGCIYLVYVFTANYLIRSLQIPRQTVFLIMFGGNFVGIFATIAGGYFSDKWGRKKSMLFGIVACFIVAAGYFALLDTKSVVLIAIAVIVFLAAIYWTWGVQPTYFGELFPTSGRYLASGLSLSLANVVGAGLLPIFAVYIEQLGGSLYVTILMLALLAFGFALALMGPETRFLPLSRDFGHKKAAT